MEYDKIYRTDLRPQDFHVYAHDSDKRKPTTALLEQRPIKEFNGSNVEVSRMKPNFFISHQSRDRNTMVYKTF